MAARKGWMRRIRYDAARSNKISRTGRRSACGKSKNKRRLAGVGSQVPRRRSPRIRKTTDLILLS